MNNYQYHNKLSAIFLALLIFICGFLLRFYHLSSIPRSLYWDEIAMFVDVKSIVTRNKDMHGLPVLQSIFYSYGDYKMPVYIWFSSIFAKIFGLSEWSVRIINVLAGSLQIIIPTAIFYNLKINWKNNKNNKIRRQLFYFYLMIITAVSPWSIIFSRVGFEGYFAQFLLLIAMIFLTKKRQTIITSIIFNIFALLATYTYFSVRFVWPILLVTYLVLFSERKKIKKTIVLLVVYLIIYWLGLQPMLISNKYRPSLDYRLSTPSILNNQNWHQQAIEKRKYGNIKFFDRIMFNQYSLMLYELAQNYSDHLSFDFIFLTGDSNLRHGTGEHGLLYLTFAPFLLIGLFVLFKDSKRIWILLTIWWLIALLPASVPENTPHALRSINAMLPLFALTAYGWATSSQILWDHPNWISRIFLIFYHFLVLINILSFFYFYFNIYPAYSATEFQDGYQQLADFVTQEYQNQHEIWIEPFDDKFFLWILASRKISSDDYSKFFDNNLTSSKINNIYIDFFDWKKVVNHMPKTFIIAFPDRIEEYLQQANKKPKRIIDILDSNHRVKFKVAVYDDG